MKVGSASWGARCCLKKLRAATCMLGTSIGTAAKMAFKLEAMMASEKGGEKKARMA